MSVLYIKEISFIHKPFISQYGLLVILDILYLPECKMTVYMNHP